MIYIFIIVRLHSKSAKQNLNLNQKLGGETLLYEIKLIYSSFSQSGGGVLLYSRFSRGGGVTMKDQLLYNTVTSIFMVFNELTFQCCLQTDQKRITP